MARFLSSRFGRVFAVALSVVVVGTLALAIDEYKSGKIWPEPKVVTPGDAGSPPSDAIVLFDGKDLSNWNGGEKWKVEDGVATSAGADIDTKQEFGDIQLHLEFATPEKVRGTGQGRGNSGIYFQQRYELQILDSYNNPTYFDGQCGAVYKQHPPLANACRKPGEWQTYDVYFTAPHFDADGKVTKPTTITAFLNGVLVQDHYELIGGTGYDHAPFYAAHPEKQPLRLQFHTNPVRFRNIWVREITPVDFTMPPEKETPAKS
jgi:hypothetical protein